MARWMRSGLIVLRCTSKLLSRLATKPAAATPPSSNALGDWYATLLRMKRGHFVLGIARNTLLPIVVSGRDLRTFPERLATTLAEVLAAYGVRAEAIERECAAMSEVQYARTDDRSTVGGSRSFNGFCTGTWSISPPRHSRSSRSGWLRPRSWRETRFLKMRPAACSAYRYRGIAKKKCGIERRGISRGVFRCFLDGDAAREKEIAHRVRDPVRHHFTTMFRSSLV